MAAPRQLARPPITEALVDFRIATDQAITLERLGPLTASLATSYPVSDPKRKMEAEFRIEEGKLIPPTARDLGFQGVWLTSADNHRIAQFRSDGFTLNNLAEYMGGDALLTEALDLWKRFADLVAPTAVTRLALRYINRLELPLATGDSFDRYLTAAPELPEGAPQKISNFLTRIVARAEVDAVAIVTQKLDGDANPGKVPLILDIDVFFAQEIAPTEAALRPLLQLLRVIKNRCFFSLLTDLALAPYEE